MEFYLCSKMEKIINNEKKILNRLKKMLGIYLKSVNKHATTKILLLNLCTNETK